MENIHLNTPYKIIPSKQKRYTAHYNIPGTDALVVPRKRYGDQLSCEVFWKDPDGVLQHKSDLMFDSLNVEPVNPLMDFHLQAVWEHTQKEVEVR